MNYNIPSIPKNLVVYNDNDIIHVKWKSVDEANKYYLHIETSNEYVQYEIPGTYTEFYTKELPENLNYSIKICSVDKHNHKSKWSEIVKYRALIIQI